MKTNKTKKDHLKDLVLTAFKINVKHDLGMTEDLENLVNK